MIKHEGESVGHSALTIATRQHRRSALEVYLQAQLLDAGTYQLSDYEIAHMLVEDLRERALERGTRIGIMEQRLLLDQDSIKPAAIRAIAESDANTGIDPSPKTIIIAGPFTLDTASGILTTPYKDPPRVELTYTEAEIATTLMRNPGRVIPYLGLVEQIWKNKDGDEMLLKVHMSHLRKKSGDPEISPKLSRHFQARSRRGYVFYT